MNKDICKVKPKRAIVYENGRPLTYVKPCGVKYTDEYEIHCIKWRDRNCEYMFKDHLEKQYEEEDL